MILLDFKQWLKNNKIRMECYGIKMLEIIESDSMMMLTYENEDFITELTIRNNGFEDIEICSKSSGEIVFFQHCMTNKDLNIDFLMGNYLNYFDKYYS